jgi:F-type H+-transporting ATPase subunit delta
MSEPLTLARPYARAAFSLANQHSELPAWSAQLEFAAQAVAQPQVAAIIGHPSLSHDAQVELLASDDAGALFKRFLLTLAENRRLVLLPEIAALFAALRAEAEKTVRARVVTATEADPEQLDQIKSALRRRFGREVAMETSIDPSLIGGVLVQAGDVVIDGSIRNKLERLRSAL